MFRHECTPVLDISISIRCINSFKLKCGSLPGILRVLGIVMNEDHSVFVGLCCKCWIDSLKIKVVTCEVLWLVFALRLSICYCIPTQFLAIWVYAIFKYIYYIGLYKFVVFRLFAVPKSWEWSTLFTYYLYIIIKFYFTITFKFNVFLYTDAFFNLWKCEWNETYKDEKLLWIKFSVCFLHTTIACFQKIWNIAQFMVPFCHYWLDV